MVTSSFWDGDATDEEDQRLIQGIIPDMVIDARGRINGGIFPDNPLDDRVSLIEHKTLASMKVTVESRAHTVQRDLKKRAEDLDSRHPGSTFAQELASYGKYFVLVFNPLVDFIFHCAGTVSAHDGVPRLYTWRYSLNAEARLD